MPQIQEAPVKPLLGTIYTPHISHPICPPHISHPSEKGKNVTTPWSVNIVFTRLNVQKGALGGGGGKIGNLWNKKKTKINSVRWQHNTQRLITNKQTKPRPVASAAPHHTGKLEIFEKTKTRTKQMIKRVWIVSVGNSWFSQSKWRYFWTSVYKWSK